ncbi:MULTISPECIES: AEC family transporter [Thermoanaerobacter]|uniref:Auxin Efflux Carrier n=2 Tax=Thermoanaerobacter TaxID=1754 RepID=B0KCQ4_THEP3|nr:MULTISPECIES: AEC family transporter [Thermoanaerobacter]ABY95511.1 Auxin Efflux Carrier [Thermoanaerobacter pseudethanolicus ATCC 33223]ADV80451.1 Auxin Efflux Carrier [Thermoanaerobacter brockii subsp. finnii Ako-1]HBW59479.1 AEC family transporter [Thermoanaerobacter sp.]
MQTFLSSVQGVLTIVFMLALGYYLAKAGWFDSSISDLFAKLVVNISLPLSMIVNITSTFSKKQLERPGRGLLIPFLSILLSYLIAYILAEIFKVKRGRKGVFTAIFSLSNSIFVGLPMSQALFGEIATPYTLLYYMANTTIWWTLGVYGIVRDTKGKDQKILTLDTLKRIFNPPLIGFIIGVILVFANIKLPKLIFDSFKMIGGLTTPLSIFYVGITIYEMSFDKFKLDKDALMVFIGRFLVTPALVWILDLFIPIPQLMRDVFIIMSAMPVMVNSAIIARVYGADYEFATSMITYTTIFSVIIMPFLMVLIKTI